MTNMSQTMQTKAKAAFAQGLTDEEASVPQSRSLTIAANVRDFYIAARNVRAKELSPVRAAAAEARRASNAEGAKYFARQMENLTVQL